MRGWAAAVAALLWAASAGAASQNPPPQQKKPDEPVATFTETVGTEYVLLPVVVTDRAGRFIGNLKEKNFRLRVEGRPVAIESFERDELAPVSFVILLDVSGSMGIGQKLKRASEAVGFLTAYRKPGDEFALFTFSEGEIRAVTDFAANPVRLLRALDRFEPSGRTALYDAVAATTDKALEGKNPKKAILLFTDGIDNDSKMTPEELTEVMQRVNIPVYAVGMKNAAFDVLSEERQKQLSVEALRQIAAASGGRWFLVAMGEDVRPIVGAIDSELRKQYLLGFAPSGSGNVKYRVVQVSVRGSSDWAVRTRRGYRGTPPKPGGGK